MSIIPNYKILLADDHAIIRNGLQFLIATIDKSTTIFQASNKEELFKELNSNSIDILILDLNSSGRWLEINSFKSGNRSNDAFLHNGCELEKISGLNKIIDIKRFLITPHLQLD